MKPTVFLFDIDGTLVDTGGAGRRAMLGAFSSLYGHPNPFEGLNFGGMTDKAIARHGIATSGATVTDAEIERALEAYVARLDAEVKKADRYRVLPGVHEVIAWLVAFDAPFALGLGTGNVKRGAMTKLEPGGLHVHFDFGGFGCDAEDRGELLAHGARRGADKLGVPLASCRVVVIGDTARDVAAAYAIGAECLGVATGGVPSSALRDAKAHHVVETLEDASARSFLVA